ncbi:8273_t:CDS:1, partial [Racocetra fulgida]
EKFLPFVLQGLETKQLKKLTNKKMITEIKSASIASRHRGETLNPLRPKRTYSSRVLRVSLMHVES